MPATTAKEIEQWLEGAKREKATHMLVICDTFDHEDYPVYVRADQDWKQIYSNYNGKQMQRVMEVYDLAEDLKPQLKAKRAMPKR